MVGQLLNRGRRASPRLPRAFRVFWLGEAVSLFGTATTATLLSLLAATQLDAGPGWMGILAAASWSPWLILGLPAGVLADRWPPHTTMKVSQPTLVIRMRPVAELPTSRARHRGHRRAGDDPHHRPLIDHPVDNKPRQLREDRLDHIAPAPGCPTAPTTPDSGRDRFCARAVRLTDSKPSGRRAVAARPPSRQRHCR